MGPMTLNICRNCTLPLNGEAARLKCNFVKILFFPSSFFSAVSNNLLRQKYGYVEFQVHGFGFVSNNSESYRLDANSVERRTGAQLTCGTLVSFKTADEGGQKLVAKVVRSLSQVPKPLSLEEPDEINVAAFIVNVTPSSGQAVAVRLTNTDIDARYRKIIILAASNENFADLYPDKNVIVDVVRRQNYASGQKVRITN